MINAGVLRVSLKAIQMTHLPDKLSITFNADGEAFWTILALIKQSASFSIKVNELLNTYSFRLSISVV